MNTDRYNIQTNQITQELNLNNKFIQNNKLCL